MQVEAVTERNEGYWKKAYASMEKAAKTLEKENQDLRQLLTSHVNTNDLLGKHIEAQEETTQVEVNDHNAQLRGMAAEIKKLRAKVRESGGSPD